MAPDPAGPDDPFPSTIDATITPGAAAAAGPSSLSSLPRSRRYQLGAPIGAGGMGEVMSAHDVHLGREVAVKRLRARTPSPDDLGRFLREARIQGRLDHPAIVPIHDLALDEDGQPFFAMKQLAGVTLHAILHKPAARESVIPVWTQARLLRAFADVCLAVEFAHTRGVVHRDLKPGNIVLGDFGEVYVLDWGVARVLAEGTDPLRASTSLPTAAIPAELAPTTPVPTAALTIDQGATSGTVLGTPGYMAPEQLRADPALGPAADIYSLGCILFEVLAGEPLHPRGVEALATTLVGVDGRPSVRAPGRVISPELDAICARATALAPGQRFLSARALADAVQGYLDGDRDHALRRAFAVKHLAEARAAGAGDRRRMMRAAGAALALDPGSTEAAELISKGLLDPPAVLPPDVVAELDASDAVYARRHARFGAVAFAAYVAFLPAFLWIGVRDWTYLAVGYSLVSINLVWSSFTVGYRRPPRYRAWVTAGIHMCIVGVFGRMLGPWIIAPGLAAATLGVLANHPHLRPTWPVALGFAAAALVPWALEVAGVLSPSYLRDPRGFIVIPPALELDLVRGPYLILGWIVGLMIVSSLLARRVARTHRESEIRYATQAWQLRQLVPEITSGAAHATG